MSFSNSNKPHSKPTAYLNLNAFNYLSEPIDSLETLYQKPWHIMSLQISTHGSNGVLFIETNLGSFVLKMNNQAPSDIFFNTVAQMIDLNVPQVKIVACYEEFFQLLTFKIEQFAQKDEQLSARLRKRMDFPFYELIEYIPSVSFLQIGKQRFVNSLINETKLQSIGICIGFDLLTNNSDRFKLNKIWSNLAEGNVANVLIQVQDHFLSSIDKIKNRQQLSVRLGEFWFIDHGGCILDIQKNKLAEENFRKYMERVCMFHEQMIQFIRGQLPLPQEFDGLVNQIQFYTKYKLTQEQLTWIIEGVIYATNMFIACFEEGAFEDLLKDLCREQINDDSLQKGKLEEIKYWDQYWNSDLKKIKLKHLEVYHLKVSAIYMTYSEVINQISNKVAKNVSEVKGKRKNHHKRKSSYLRKQSNNRPQSKHSQLNQKKPKIDLSFLDSQDINNQDQLQQSPEEKQKRLQIQRKQHQRLLKQEAAKKKLQQRLQAFQVTNYQKQY